MIVIIHGDNSLRSRTALKGYMDRLQSLDFVVEKTQSEDITTREIDGFFNAQSLFGEQEKKALVLLDFFTTKHNTINKDVVNAVGNTKDAYVILYDDVKIKKNADIESIQADNIIECKNPTRQEAINWLDQFASHNNRIPPGIISTVFDKCEGDLWLAYSELIKLDTYCLGKGVEARDIDTLMIGNNTDDNIFKMIDFLFGSREKEAFAMLYSCKKYGVSALLILSMIERHIRLIELLRDQTKKGQTDVAVISANIGAPAFVVKKHAKYLQKYDTEKIKSLYDRLEAYDEKIKVGALDPYFSCELVFFAVVSM